MGTETGAKVRVVEIEGSPWFVAADAIRALGLTMYAGATVHLTALTADEKRTLTPASLSNSLGRSSVPEFGPTKLAFISESGLYKLVLRAQPDRSERVQSFQNWVTRDVLPAIRKDGSYVRGEELLKPGRVEQLDLNDLDALRDQIERLQARKIELLEQRFAEAEARIGAAAQKIAEQAPAA